jgi:hypothetical protein
MLGARAQYQLVSATCPCTHLCSGAVMPLLPPLRWGGNAKHNADSFARLLAVPPAYYAHLAAFRARFYMEPDTSDSGSMASGATMSRGPPPGSSRGSRPVGNVAVRPLPALKENVKRVMFYC